MWGYNASTVVQIRDKARVSEPEPETAPHDQRLPAPMYISFS